MEELGVFAHMCGFSGCAPSVNVEMACLCGHLPRSQPRDFPLAAPNRLRWGRDRLDLQAGRQSAALGRNSQAPLSVGRRHPFSKAGPPMESH